MAVRAQSKFKVMLMHIYAYVSKGSNVLFYRAGLKLASHRPRPRARKGAILYGDVKNKRGQNSSRNYAISGEKITPEGKRINVIDLTNSPPLGKESAQTPR